MDAPLGSVSEPVLAALVLLSFLLQTLGRRKLPHVLSPGPTDDR